MKQLWLELQNETGENYLFQRLLFSGHLTLNARSVGDCRYQILWYRVIPSMNQMEWIDWLFLWISVLLFIQRWGWQLAPISLFLIVRFNNWSFPYSLQFSLLFLCWNLSLLLWCDMSEIRLLACNVATTLLCPVTAWYFVIC